MILQVEILGVALDSVTLAFVVPIIAYGIAHAVAKRRGARRMVFSLDVGMGILILCGGLLVYVESQAGLSDPQRLGDIARVVAGDDVSRLERSRAVGSVAAVFGGAVAIVSAVRLITAE